MTTSRQQDGWVDAVAKLTELTQGGQLQWRVDEWADAPGAISPAYSTTYNNRHLRLQKRRVRETMFLGPDTVKDSVILELIGETGKTLWTVPDVDATEDLFAAVQYRTADVKAFLHDILGSGS